MYRQKERKIKMKAQEVFNELTNGWDASSISILATDERLMAMAEQYVDWYNDGEEAFEGFSIDDLKETIYMDLLDSFKFTDKIWGYTSFEEFEKECDSDIYYADGTLSAIERAITEEGRDMSEFEIYLFDDWFVALSK